MKAGGHDVLLVTGCVKPVEGQAYLALKDAGERLKQYRDCLLYYIEKTGFTRIVFCDNSGQAIDFETLERVARDCGKELEILSFRGDSDGTRVRGKGYGEGEIVAYVLEHSRWAGEMRFFIKVTGRLIVRNLEDIRTRLDSSRFYINRLLIRNNPNVLDTRLYAIPVEKYKRHFLNLYKTVCVEYTLEHLFIDCVRKEGILCWCFPRYPEFRGICGGDGMVYGEESPMLLRTYRWASAFGVFNNRWFAGGVARWRNRGTAR